ncbi:MAG: DUF362 domain-containing protein [bacterium]
MGAKCTHGAVVRPVIDYVLKALNGRGHVSFGNAPMQSTDWSKVVEETGAGRVEEFYRHYPSGGVDVVLTDLRHHVVSSGTLGIRKVRHHSEDDSDCVRVDLGSRSLLEELQQNAEEPRFRVLDYDPRRTSRSHGRNRHNYFINRRVLACNVIISIPKLKTHEKVGVTCGLKGCVGTVAHKDCLAHHRYGPPSEGGDEYPESMAMLRMVSALHEKANLRQIGILRNVLSGLDSCARKVVRRFTRSLSGGWPGNDTCWRMALDLARIVTYADINGLLQSNPQRKHIMITDGIIAGEGDGPLSPVPVEFGYVSFSDNLAIGDYVNSLAMGFDPDKIPLIHEACYGDCRLVDTTPADCLVQFNGHSVSMAVLTSRFDRQFIPPREWRAALLRILPET